MSYRKERRTCPCGKNVTKNTLKTHILSKRCVLQDKQGILQLLKLKTAHCYAWKKSLGPEALKDPDWIWSIMQKESKLEDWVFRCPRIKGSVRPSTALNYSIKRKGRGNPTYKTKIFQYSKKEVLEYLKEVYQKILNDDTIHFYPDLYQTVNSKYPNYRYLLTDELQKYKKYNSFQRDIFLINPGLTIDEWRSIYFKKRGKFISRGQLASPICRLKASETASKMVSTWRISKPERILFEMIKSIDHKASRQYRIEHKNRWFAFDIFSPAFNTVIEMHGRVWHDVSKAPKGLIKYAIENEEKDILKQEGIKLKGIDYHVFWDDQTGCWENLIKEYFGKKPISYEEAEDKVNKKAGDKAGL